MQQDPAITEDQANDARKLAATNNNYLCRSCKVSASALYEGNAAGSLADKAAANLLAATGRSICRERASECSPSPSQSACLQPPSPSRHALTKSQPPVELAFALGRLFDRCPHHHVAPPLPAQHQLVPRPHPTVYT